MTVPDPHAEPAAILFSCTNNAIRSPMAAALMRHLYGHRIFVDSVGVRAGTPDPFAAAAMEEMGIDLSRHRPRTFDDLEDTSFDVIVTLSPEAHHSALELTRHMACDVEYWPTIDPSVVEGSRENRLDAYREVRDGLMRRIKQRFGPPRPPNV